MILDLLQGAVAISGGSIPPDAPPVCRDGRSIRCTPLIEAGCSWPSSGGKYSSMLLHPPTRFFALRRYSIARHPTTAILAQNPSYHIKQLADVK